MRVITARNVNDALSDALWWLKVAGAEEQSRNGLVLAAPGPVATVYTKPCERVLFSALRDANPFFHLMESIWMLAGANDVAFPATYAKQIAEYSDDGETLHGAYGHRWRRHFGIDQLEYIINALSRDPTTRRAVLTMWDPQDLDIADAGGKDIPCNTHTYFSAQRGVLDMTVCCRSNDAVWGCYGANAMHFSMLLQLIAETLGIPVGRYTQFSNNLHVYSERKDVQRLLNADREVFYVPDDRYVSPNVNPKPLLFAEESYEDFIEDAVRFVREPASRPTYNTQFFNTVIHPMQLAHAAHKAGQHANALIFARTIAADDWRIACVEWLERRI